MAEQVLITGGAGFIGSHLADELIGRGYRVRALDNLCAQVHGRAGRRPSYLAADVELVVGDVRDRSCLREAARGCDAVYHLAALGSVPRSMKHPDLTHDVNVDGTYNAFLAAQSCGAKAIVFSSSSSVYGDDPNLPKVEERIGRPLSPYAASKRTGEVEAEGFAKVFDGRIVGLRYFNVYGPRQRHDSPYAAVIPLFFRAALKGEAPRIFGDGLQSRDFTYVSDVAKANLLAAEAPLPPGRAHLFNVGASGSTSVLDLWRIIARLTGASASPVHDPPRAGDVRDSRASIERAAAELGFRPSTDLARGLEETLSWYQRSVPAVPEEGGRGSGTRSGGSSSR